jgi:hypothetical protein
MTDARTLRICTLALALTLSAIGLFLYRPRSDFSMFYASGTLWRAGHPVYTAEQPNLNPPFAIVTLFAPLSFLSYDAARIVWIALGCAAIAASIRIVARTLHWHLRRAAIALACMLLTYPAWLVWFQGQMIWLLMYPATLAWQAMREKRHIQAGFWLAPVIALKPPLALTALALPWRVWLSAGIGSAAMTAVSVMLTGMDVWREWWHFRDAVFWLGLPDNVSLWGVVARTQSGVLLGGRLREVPVVASAAIVTIAAVCWWSASRVSDPDTRFSLAWLTAILFMPLGWIYYVLVGSAPLMASWRHFPDRWVAFLIFCVPLSALAPIIDRAPATLPILGSFYCAGMVIGWWSWRLQREEASATVP